MISHSSSKHRLRQYSSPVPFSKLAKRTTKQDFFKDIDPIDETNKQYFPDTIKKNRPRNNKSKSLRNSTRVYRRFTENPKGLISSSRDTVNSHQSHLQREIQRLNKELNVKDKEIVITKSRIMEQKLKQSEMVQLYRIVSYYEGKIKEMQLNMKVYEEGLRRITQEWNESENSKNIIIEFSCLFEEIRMKNQELAGKNEEYENQIYELNNKIRKLQNKLHSKNSSTENTNPNKMSPNQKIRQIGIRNKLKWNYGNINSKVNIMEGSLAYLRKQNQRFSHQLQQKQKQIRFLQEEVINMRIKLKAVVDSQIEEQKMKEQKLSSISAIQNISNNTKVFQRQSQQLSIIELKKELILKLRYNLILETLKYQELINFLSDQNLSPQHLQQQPFNLTKQQAQQLASYIQQLHENYEELIQVKEKLMRKIPVFQNMTFKKENELQVELMKEFKARENEFMNMFYRQDQPTKANFEEVLNYFRGWNFTTKQIDHLGKISYESLGHCCYFDLSLLRDTFLATQ